MKLLCACYVPQDLALDWAEGRLSDLQVWQSDQTGTGSALFIAEMEGRMSWRALARLVQAIPPKQLIFRTKLDSMVKRSHQFGARPLFKDAPGNLRYFADGPELESFLSSLGVKQ